VVFDSVSGPASVSRIVGRSEQRGYATTPTARAYFHGQGVSTSLLCARTPCVAYLPYGDNEVALESTDGDRRAVYVVTSSDVPRALRASLDLHIPRDVKRPLGVVAVVTGLIGAGLGAVLLAQQDPNGSSHTAGATVVGVGGLVALVGGILFATGHPAVSYEGQGTVWDLKGSSPPPAVPTGSTQL
jgi:hypothetical protein